MSDLVSALNGFKALLDDVSVTEQDCQDFLERNTKFFYAPFTLNHGIHHSSIISKFPLDTSLVTDFAYLTKSSDYWNLVLVELEHPLKKLFRNNLGKVIPSSELTEAIAQVNSWRDFIRKNDDEVIRRLDPIRKPLQENPVFFKYLLVIGRSQQKSHSQAMRDSLSSLGREDFQICTYDSLINYYLHNRLTSPLNVLRLVKNRFQIKHLHSEPETLLVDLTSEHLDLTTTQSEFLISRGYEIDQWEQGKSLAVNGKQTFDSWRETSRLK